MTAELSRPARLDLRAYVYHIVAATGPEAALREHLRVRTALARFAEAPIDGVEVTLPDWPRPARRHFVHPFHVYYERRPGGIFVIRLHHHARRPIER